MERKIVLIRPRGKRAQNAALRGVADRMTVYQIP
jgi:hypothetical protein